MERLLEKNCSYGRQTFSFLGILRRASFYGYIRSTPFRVFLHRKLAEDSIYNNLPWFLLSLLYSSTGYHTAYIISYCRVNQSVVKYLSSIAKTKLVMKNVEHKLKEATFCGSQRDVHLGQFFVIIVSNYHQQPILTSFNFSTFLKILFIEKRLSFSLTTVKCFEHLAPTERLNLLSCDYKLKCATQALFTRANYPVVSKSD